MSEQFVLMQGDPVRVLLYGEYRNATFVRWLSESRKKCRVRMTSGFVRTVKREDLAR